jgi:hypothetical protein
MVSSVPPNVGTGYSFRSWHYVVAKVAFGRPSDQLYDVYLDSGSSLSIASKQWLTISHPDCTTRTRAKPVSVSGVGANRSWSSEYVIADLLFPGTHNQKPAWAKVTHEIHLVDTLAANLIVGADILGPQQFELNIAKKSAYIAACNVHITIDSTTRPNPAQGSVSTQKPLTVPPRSTHAISVIHTAANTAGCLLFEPIDTPISLFSCLTHNNLSAVLARNDTDQPVYIPAGLKLGDLFEMDETHCYQIVPEELTPDLIDIALRSPARPNQQKTPLPPMQLLETTHSSGMTIYDKERAVAALGGVIDEFPVTLWTDEGFVNIPEDQWLKVELRPDWRDRISGKAKIYPLGTQDKQIVERTFTTLTHQGRATRTLHATPFSFPVFVARQTLPDGERKGRVVIDVRPLNHATLPDVYPMTSQGDIYELVAGKQFLTRLDATSFFNQWRNHPSTRRCFTVSTHLGQFTFNCILMGFQNSPAYTQRQMDTILADLRAFARAFIDDIIVASTTLGEHVQHLREPFQRLVKYNIALNPHKCFLGYPSTTILGRHVDSLGLSTSRERVEAIAKIAFPQTAQQLERYLGLANWLRDKVPRYAQMVEPLQRRKTELLKRAPTKGKPRKTFAAKEAFAYPTGGERAAFDNLQTALCSDRILTIFDPSRQLLIDFDASKEQGIGAMAYHIDQPGSITQYPVRTKVKPILFISRILRQAEHKYWPTELETCAFVWVLKKLKHLIEGSRIQPVIIYTDHSAICRLPKKSDLTSTTSTEKTNLRLVLAAEFIARF